MEYYAKETQLFQFTQKTAGIKARDDLDQIFRENGIVELIIPTENSDRTKSNPIKKIKNHFDVEKTWYNKTKHLSSGDILYIQFPAIEHTILFSKIIKRLNKQGVITVILIHDLEILRDGKRNDISVLNRIRHYIEETRTLMSAKCIISHNTKMTEWLIKYGVAPEKIIDLQIFDYLIPGFDKRIKLKTKRIEKDLPVIIGGNLRFHKAQYAYSLPDNCSFNLYGVDYAEDEKDNIHYYGAFPPDDLPFEMEGSFGLVWDGISTKTCAGIYGEYLKINNPHKTSLYLASGIPVAIWKDAALGEFVEKSGVGICIESIDDLSKKIEQISNEEYANMLDRVNKISYLLRNGYYTKNAIQQVRNRYEK